ncbi:DUF3999 domain-containing protein [Candidatus Electronema sp. PJ]|uniref:DUF3999 domain-containing protein n=1 Tax=Candidatus Electronema sp. PJ TaxID=3401572 RepID=UPI003AA89661
MKHLAVLFALLTALPCHAAEEQNSLHREDFAYGMELTVSGKKAMYSLMLPAEVYQGCTRPDLGDLRVFNAQGPVPHLLRQPQPEKQSARPPQSLPYFPLSETTQANGNLSDHGLTISGNGAIIALNKSSAIIALSTGATEQATQVVAAYILDASAVEQPPDWLELAWQGQGEQFSTSVRIDHSDDLDNWQQFVPSAALAELRFSGHNLLRNRIELPRQARGKYFRLSWPAGKDGVSLTAVKAGYEEEAQVKPHSVLTLTGQPLTKNDPNRTTWQYNTQGFFPVDQLKIRLPEQNYLAMFTVHSGGEEHWQRRASLLTWQLTIDGVKLENELLHLPPSTDRLWRLETEVSTAQAPILELGWLPGQLIFMAQGQGPYTLAYGRAGLLPAHSPVGQLLDALEPLKGSSLLAAAQAGPQVVLGGQAQLQPVVKMPWRTWLLWAGLIAGVLAVGAMALKLFREMNRHK